MLRLRASLEVVVVRVSSCARHEPRPEPLLADSGHAHHVPRVQIGFQSDEQRGKKAASRPVAMVFLQRWIINTLAVLVATHVDDEGEAFDGRLAADHAVVLGGATRRV